MTSNKALRSQALEMEQDPAGLQRLKFRRQGWSYWKWDGHDIHYVKAGAALSANTQPFTPHSCRAAAYCSIAAAG